MQNIRSFAGLIGSAWNGGLNPATYTASTSAPTQGSIFVKGVPAQYQNTMQQVSQHTGIPAQKLSAQFNAENGGNWSPTLRGRTDPTDFGMTQMNPAGVGIITGKAGPMRNYFKDAYGTEFDRTNPQHQMLGAGVYMNYLKQFGLPGAGIKIPTTTDIQTSYNTGATGYAKAKAGDPTWASRARNYQRLIASHEAN